MDIGTNTEISLIHQGQIFSASCPSGPALEGGHISCGMRAAEGAIERVDLAADGSLTLKVIGKRRHRSACAARACSTSWPRCTARAWSMTAAGSTHAIPR